MTTGTILLKYLRHLRHMNGGGYISLDAVELALRLALEELAESIPSISSTDVHTTEQLGAANHIQDDDYIWRPVRVHGVSNFANTGALAPDTNRHITQSTVNEILTSLLRRYYLHTARAAGLDRAAASLYANEQAARYSIHSLRHMFAWTLHKASGNNIKMVQEKLGHHDVSTTMRYLEHLEEPVDDHSGLIARQLGLSI